MNVTVKFFALARDLAGTDEITLSFPAALPASAVIDQLVARFPKLQEWKQHIRIAVNCEYAASDKTLQDGDEVAIIPPVSGG